MKHEGNIAKDREQPPSLHSKFDLAVMNSTDGDCICLHGERMKGWGGMTAGWDMNILYFNSSSKLNYHQFKKKKKAGLQIGWISIIL